MSIDCSCPPFKFGDFYRFGLKTKCFLYVNGFLPTDTAKIVQTNVILNNFAV